MLECFGSAERNVSSGLLVELSAWFLLVESGSRDFCVGLLKFDLFCILHLKDEIFVNERGELIFID